MANVGDDIVSNILSRLPGKALLRFRSVSKHWNGLISDPYFMKSRSRQMIFLTLPRHRLVIDDNVPVEDKAHSMFQIHSPLLEHLKYVGRVSIVGTYNGIVLLDLTDRDTSFCCWLILYNPLTRASKNVLDMDLSRCYDRSKPFVFGFGDDFKIVRFEFDRSVYIWDVFDPKTRLWSGQPRYLKRDFQFWGDTCLFLNGFLYWKTYSPSDHGVSRILALNVKEMVTSRIKLPFRFDRFKCVGDLLGSVDGQLCMLNAFNTTTFDLWVQKEQGVEISWMKAHSFTVRLEPSNIVEWRPVCILGNGKILFTTSEMRLVVYDTSKDTYGTFYHFENGDSISRTYPDLFFIYLCTTEYVESLVFPF